MWINIISLFPEMFNIIIKYGIINKAIKKKILNVNFWNPRDFSNNKKKKIDDYPYGGGSGMIMMLQPLLDCIIYIKKKIGKKVKVIYLSPQGKIFNQNKAIKISKKYKKIILVCGRYKGIDERLINYIIDEEWSIGNYILSGGELPAMVIIDAIVRYIPGVIKNTKSIINDSFNNNFLDCPYYTKPKKLYNLKVPKILLSGNHYKINQWRLKKSLGRTWIKKPFLLKNKILNNNEIKLLNEYKNNTNFFLNKNK